LIQKFAIQIFAVAFRYSSVMNAEVMGILSLVFGSIRAHSAISTPLCITPKLTKRFYMCGARFGCRMFWGWQGAAGLG